MAELNAGNGSKFNVPGSTFRASGNFESFKSFKPFKTFKALKKGTNGGTATEGKSRCARRK